MLQDIVNNQIDFTTLQTLTPKLDSLNLNETKSAETKSFDQMIQDVRQNKDAVPRSENSEKKDPVEGGKVSDSEKSAVKPEEKTSGTDEKSETKSDVSEKTEKKSDKCDFDNKKIKSESKKTFSKGDVKKDKKISASKSEEHSFRNIEDLVRKAKKNISENEISLETENVKNLTIETQEELSAAMNVSKEISDEKIDISYDDFSIVSEDSFEVKTGETDDQPKFFSFDKDGKITVKDFRTEKTENLETEKNPKTNLKVTDVKFDGKNNAEMTMEVVSNVQQNLTSSNDQTASAAGSNFQAMLTNQIQQNAGEFVKAGNIILKDNDVGSIKLILKPEQLGNVKIDLQINDKSITGRILVASQEAYNAFKESAESLKQAFINSGFESAGLELSFAGQNNSGNQMANQENQSKQFAMQRSYGNLTETEISGEFESEEILSNSMRNSVNIVA